MFAASSAFKKISPRPVWSNTAQRMLATGERTYVGYSIYKGKAALNIKPLPPTFKAGKSGRSIDREGALYLEFAPSGAGPREYNWNQKVAFSLDVTECGKLLTLENEKNVEFLHDPNMGGNICLC